MRLSLFAEVSRLVLLSALVIAPATLARAQDAPKATELEEIKVTAERETAKGHVNGIVARKSASATKTGASIAETPQSISVVTSDQIERQGAESVAESLRYEPGIQPETRPGSRYDSYMARGFGGFGGNANYVSYWDGLRLPKGVSYNIPSIDPYLLERVEVLRGPASAIYGQGFPGGLVNLVSKQPSLGTLNELMVRTGNKGLAEVGADLNGKLNADGTLLYRVIGLGRTSEAEVDHVDDKRLLLAPSLTWRPDLDTSITAQVVYERDPTNYYSYWLPAVGTLQSNANGKIPRDFFVGDPSFDNFERTQVSAGYQAEHRFDETWVVRQNFRYTHLESDSRLTSFRAYVNSSYCGLAAGTSNLCMSRTPTRYIETLDQVALDNMVQADFSTGALVHKLTIGLDLQHLDADADYGTGSTSYVSYVDANYSAVSSPSLTTRQQQKRTQAGLYAQDQIALGNWRALIGVREDWTDASTSTKAIATNTGTAYDTTDHAFTWRAGLLYRFDNGISPYAAYSTSFDPTMGTGYGGTPFDPTTSQQYELGIKYEPTWMKGLFTAAVYDLTQQNVLTTDTAHTSTNTTTTLCSSTTCQVQTGEVHSQGFELGAKAEIMAGLNLMLAYTFTDAEVTQSNVAGVQGKTPVGIARHTASAWTDYTFSSGALDGLTIGAGVRYNGESFGDTTNTDAMKVPAFALVDAAMQYDFGKLRPEMKNWRGSLTGSNLFDKDYVASCASATQCFYGSGRTVRATMAFRW